MIFLLAAALSMTPSPGIEEATPAGLTLAEARSMPAAALAVRLLGAAGSGSDFREKRITADTGGLLNLKGLVAIDLLPAPVATWYRGICAVEGVRLHFDTSRPEDGSRGVSSFDKFKWYKQIAVPPAIPWRPGTEADARCATAAPVLDGERPNFFIVKGPSDDLDRSKQADFAIRAIAKAQLLARRSASAIRCRKDPSEPADRTCHDPKRLVTTLSVDQLAQVAVAPCGIYWCIDAVWRLRGSDSEWQELHLKAATTSKSGYGGDAFAVSGVRIGAETWIAD